MNNSSEFDEMFDVKVITVESWTIKWEEETFRDDKWKRLQVKETKDKQFKKKHWQNIIKYKRTYIQMKKNYKTNIT